MSQPARGRAERRGTARWRGFSSLSSLPGFDDAGYVTFLVPGVLMMTVLYSGAWAGTGYSDDLLLALHRDGSDGPHQVALIGISQIVVLPVTFLSTTMMPSSDAGVGADRVRATR